VVSADEESVLHYVIGDREGCHGAPVLNGLECGLAYDGARENRARLYIMLFEILSNVDAGEGRARLEGQRERKPVGLRARILLGKNEETLVFLCERIKLIETLSAA
jgi:hypothetical protein